MCECCMWCEKENDLYEIDAGHVFCSEKCESDYYQDRENRKKSGKFPLLLERKLERGTT